MSPDATIADLYTAAEACNRAASGGDEGTAAFLLEDLGLALGAFGSFRAAAIALYAEIDRRQPSKPFTVVYTTALERYDGFGTRTLEHEAGHDNRGQVIRKVRIEDEHYTWQTTRYASGMYACVEPAEVVKFQSIWKLNGA